jgi:hypothetical protein
MSTTPETDFSLELHFLPAWAKESPAANKFENFRGAPERSRDGDRDRKFTRRDRPPRRPMSGPGGPGATSGPGRGPGGPRGDRDQRGPRPPRRDGPGRRDDRRGPARPMAPQVILPDVQVAFVPDDAGVDSLSRQIRTTGRAYPVFEIAQMVLAKPERHSVTFSVKKKADGGPAQPLFLCALDDSLWLSEDDAVRHVLDRHFATFYQPEKTQIDPPKGVYTFVAQCSLSGAILGPPNHHDYQNHLRRLHQERFGRMPFEMFKSKVRIVRDEAIVKKWLDDQSWKTEFLCLNLPETLKLPTREEVEKHFRQVHLANIIKPVETHRLSGPASRNLRDRRLAQLLRVRWEEQRWFPMQVATALSQQFAARGLQFFKVNRTITHVAVARPHYLDMEATPVSDGVRKIVEFVNSHPKCTHKQLLEALAPAPTVIPIAPFEGAAPAPAEPSPELTTVMMDLHWLVQQGHVIEFANGVLETAKKPLPRPVKAAPTPEDAAAPAAAAPAEGEVTGTAEPVVTATEAEAPPAAAETTASAEEVTPAPETPAQS